jgi:hypothetical protein
MQNQAMSFLSKRSIAKIPGLGGATETTWRQWKEASTQFGVVFLISMLPPILTALIQFVRLSTSNGTGQYEFISPGELLVSVTALIAPSLWVMIDYHRRRKVFEDFIFFTMAVIILIAASTALFVMDKIHSPMSANRSLEVGAYLYAFGLLLWYLSLLYQARLNVPYEEVQRAQEKALGEEVATFDPRNP